MRLLALITWNDLRQSFSDRTLLLLMFAAPLAIATIISVTFGELADESSPVDDLPLAVVNADRGSPVTDFGERFELAVGAADGPPPAGGADDGEEAAEGPSSVDDGADGSVVFGGLRAYRAPDETVAREWLLAGDVSAVIVLPEDLSRRLTSGASGAAPEVRVITRPDREVSGGIALTLARGILGEFAAGLSITRAAVAGVASAEGVSPPSVLGRPSFRELTDSLAGPIGSDIRIEQEALHRGGIGFNPLVAFGATQAIFFALFTANGNATSILEERRDGTLLRLLAAPTPHGAVLAGKLVSTGVMVVVQLAMLFVAFTAIGSLLEGRLVFIWGDRLGLILVVLLVTSTAAAGIGGIVAAAARSPEQAGVVGTVITMFMAITGGAFGFRFDNPIRYASAVYWGADAFETLAAGGRAIWTNVAVLGGFAAVAVGLAYLIFARRFRG